MNEKNSEKELASALNLEICYRKFTCLLKVGTNNALFKQQGIDNKERIINLKKLLNDDTRPKCYATMSDMEIFMMKVKEGMKHLLNPPLKKTTVKVGQSGLNKGVSQLQLKSKLWH